MQYFPFFQKLVSIPSPTGSEERIASHILETCMGSRRTAMQVGKSVIVHIPGKDRSKAFLLNGHIDTVPPTPHWTTDPFTLLPDKKDKDRFTGLGATDMKSGIAIMLEISETFRKKIPTCDIWLLFAESEETNNAGSKVLAKWFHKNARAQYKTLGGIILEPTDAEYIAVGHRGVTNWEITANGPGGHASKHFDDESPAMEKIVRFFSVLPSVRKEWDEKYVDPFLGRPSINPTIISCGKTINVVPTSAEATINLRITPQLVKDLPILRQKWEKTYDIQIKELWEPHPTLCQPNEKIYQAAKKALPNIPFKAFPGATDQIAFDAYDIPMLIYGPGSVATMHQPDEYVLLSNVRKCADNLSRIMDHFYIT